MLDGTRREYGRIGSNDKQSPRSPRLGSDFAPISLTFLTFLVPQGHMITIFGRTTPVPPKKPVELCPIIKTTCIADGFLFQVLRNFNSLKPSIKKEKDMSFSFFIYLKLLARTDFHYSTVRYNITLRRICKLTTCLWHLAARHR